ncbi:hypothetical protein BX600DRAFT_514083 [Xylariales sp. PMI_506]|nr:hypothetical protein BX600DRAFT_514083 [Xylariales sp. PMI_506]
MVPEADNGGKSDQPGPGKAPCKRKFKPKAKTGCHTCRIRRVKCDEGRPACHRCVSTSRVCDGYPSIFQIVTVGRLPPAAATPTPQLNQALSIYRPRASIISADDVNKLAHHFTIKHGDQANVGYHSEARAVLAKLSDPTIRYALTSLGALHDGLQARQPWSGSGGSTALNHTHRGLEAYNMAITSLASRLVVEPNQESARAAILCCQLFISIETFLGDYTSSIRHFIHGMRIMHQYRNRGVPRSDYGPAVSSSASIDLPSLDCFVLKLFASAYSGAGQKPMRERGETGLNSLIVIALGSSLCHQARSELNTLSAQAIGYLNQPSHCPTGVQIASSRTWKVQMLARLGYWNQMYSQMLDELMRSSDVVVPVRFNAIFSLILYGVLKVVVSLAMSNSSADVEALEGDFQNLTQISIFATEVKKLAANNASISQSRSWQVSHDRYFVFPS